MNMMSGTHIDIERIDITKDQRYYTLPNDALKIVDIRCKNHDNANDEYRSIPRSVFKPPTDDADGI